MARQTKSAASLMRRMRIAGPDDPIYQGAIVTFTPVRRTRPRFDFRAAVIDGLLSLGARSDGPYGWQLDTVAGILDISPYDDWVACRFDDVARAKETIGFGCLNPNSGKWNWHYCKPTIEDVRLLLSHFSRIKALPGTSSTSQIGG